jgi:small subunit ribosomal protein S2
MAKEKKDDTISSDSLNEVSKKTSVDIMDMLKAGVHFGHKKSKWNPKMEQYVYAMRDNVRIIDLQTTIEKLEEALEFIKKISKEKGIILFIGTRRQAKTLVKSAAERCGMPFVAERWIGGTFTNFKVILKRIKKLKEMKEEKNSEGFKKFTKKEQIEFSREFERIEKKLGGIRNLEKLPDALFIIDVNKDLLAVKEAQKLKIPVVALVDTDVDPTIIDYPIPSNDDAIQAIKIMTAVVADAVIEGKNIENK